MHNNTKNIIKISIYYFLFILFISSCNNIDSNEIYLTQDNYFKINTNEKLINIDTNINKEFIELNLDLNINKPLYKVISDKKDNYKMFLSYSISTNMNTLKDNTQKNITDNQFKELFSEIQISNDNNVLTKNYLYNGKFVSEITLKINQDIINFLIVSDNNSILKKNFNLKAIKNRIIN